MESLFDKAKRYYPVLWNKQRIATLVKAGLLSPKDYKAITGDVYVDV